MPESQDQKSHTWVKLVAVGMAVVGLLFAWREILFSPKVEVYAGRILITILTVVAVFALFWLKDWLERKLEKERLENTVEKVFQALDSIIETSRQKIPDIHETARAKKEHPNISQKNVDGQSTIDVVDSTWKAFVEKTGGDIERQSKQTKALLASYQRIP